jgi:hypothetical protein
MVQERSYVAIYLDHNKKHMIFVPALKRYTKTFSAVNLSNSKCIPKK